MGESSRSGAAPPQPWIFLSHSGQQKEFARTLYRDLLHVHHHPFFDEDTIHSLPRGHDYPLRIFRACHGCKLGVVVLSHDYMESLWPMIELQHLLLSNPNRPVYPLFYGLEPADLHKEENLQRWKKAWTEKSRRWQTRMQDVQKISSQVQINLDSTSWPDILKRLQYRNGVVRKHYQSDYEYVRAIVCSICSLLPSPRPYLVEDEVEGHERMMKEIEGLFDNQEGSRDDDVVQGAETVSVVGMHGIGGSGKSTLCKAMANYYSQQFSGKSWWLELPSSSNEDAMLVNRIKDILPSMSYGLDDVKRVSTLDMAMLALVEGLRRNKVFMALDNVWDVGLQIARKILLTEYVPGSRVLVTSRSGEILKRLQPGKAMQRPCNMPQLTDERIVHVPSKSVAEAVKALKSYSCFSDYIPLHHLTRLARSFFFEGQCYPLLLKFKGARLRETGRPGFSDRDWGDVIDSLMQVENNVDYINSEEQVLKVLLKSFEILSHRLQNIFADLATCHLMETMELNANCEWLAMLESGSVRNAQVMRHQILTLEYHGLLEIRKIHYVINAKPTEVIRIHDLYKSVAMQYCAARDSHTEYTLQMRGLSYLPSSSLEKLVMKHKCVRFEYGFSKSKFDVVGQLLHIITNTKKLPNLQVLWIHGFDHDFPSLYQPAVRNMEADLDMQALRHMRLEGINFVEVNCWERFPNLVSLHLNCKSLLRIGLLGVLTKLQSLVLNCHCLQLQALVGKHEIIKGCLVKVGDVLPNLQVLELPRNNHLVEVGPLSDAFPALQRLNLKGCPSLESFPVLKLDRLSSLNLGSCKGLKRFEGSASSLTALRELRLEGCKSLESIEGLRGSLLSLMELRLTDCSSLRSIRDLSGLRTLRTLDASECFSLRRLKSICSLTALEELHLRMCTGLESIPDLSGLLRLKILNISWCIFLKRFEGSVSSLTALEELSIQGCRELESIPGLTGLLMLRYLDVSDCPSLKWSEGSISSLSECREVESIPDMSNLLRLRTLDAWKCFTLREGDIPGVGNLPALEKLKLSIGSELAGPDHEVCQLPATLQVLHLQTRARQLDSLSALTSLKKLELWAPWITDLSSLTPLTSLEKLHILDCRALTDVHSLTALTSLEKLSISGCPMLTELPDLTHIRGLSTISRSPLISDDYMLNLKI